MATITGTSTTNGEKNDIKNFADKDGHFRRQESQFRNWISSEPGARFPPAAKRYILYLNRGCPWAHRTNIVRSLKGLEDVIDLVEMSATMGPDGWQYDGSQGSAEKDPITGSTKHKDLYLLSDPKYEGRFTVPVLFDTKEKTVVNNESSEVIRMMYSKFDQFLPEDRREASKAGGGLLPERLRSQIDDMNGWVYEGINNAVYKTGFATSQQAYDENIVKLFENLDRMEDILEKSDGPFVFGEHVTEADIRLYTTIVRFDPAYHTTFRCNLKMIRHDYPAIQRWLIHVYYDESDETRGAFRHTTYFDAIKHGYANASKLNAVPMGPLPHMLPKPKSV